MEPPEWVARLPEEGIMTVGHIKLLQKSCAVYMLNEEEMWVTLKRKQQLCVTEEDERDMDAARAKCLSLDGHGVGMAKVCTATSLRKSGARAEEVKSTTALPQTSQRQRNGCASIWGLSGVFSKASGSVWKMCRAAVLGFRH